MKNVTIDLDDYSPYLRSILAKETYSEEILDYLARDSNADVRYAVANNSYTSSETLSKLSEDIGKCVCEAAIENPNFRKNQKN